MKTVRDIVKSILILMAVTVLGYVFYALHITDTNIVAIYIFGVLLISVITANRVCGFVSSFISVMLFNFFFTIPRFTFHFNNPDYIVTFVIMFIVAFLTGSLALQLKDSAQQSARSAFRTQILFETSQLLQKEKEKNSVLNVTAEQLMRLLKKDIVVYAVAQNGKG